jgi:hypothetical protein
MCFVYSLSLCETEIDVFSSQLFCPRFCFAEKKIPFNHCILITIGSKGGVPISALERRAFAVFAVVTTNPPYHRKDAKT